MKDFQLSSKEELQKKFEDISYWTRIHEKKLRRKKQAEKPARILQDGVSQIWTYYDEQGKYLCTMHKVISKDGSSVVHEHIKDCLLDGIWYKCTDGIEEG
jgi:hypothetical protein